MIEALAQSGKSDSLRVTRKGLRLAPGMDFQAWATLGARITGISSACAWCLGDWLVYGEEAFGERYKVALDATCLDYQTLRNYAWVARRFELARRREGVSFQHHAEVAALPEPEQDLWLQRAERSRWSRNELRKRLSSERRANRSTRSEHPIRLSIEVTSTRERRWREAATAADQTLGEWIAGVIDAAADVALIGRPSSTLPEQLGAIAEQGGTAELSTRQ